MFTPPDLHFWFQMDWPAPPEESIYYRYFSTESGQFNRMLASGVSLQMNLADVRGVLHG